MILIIQLLLLLPSKIEGADESMIALAGCQGSCGGIDIPYPFGIGTNCFIEGFEVSCKADKDGVPRPLLISSSSDEGTHLLDVILPLGQARISHPVSFQCYDNATYDIASLNGSGTPYKLNNRKNKFTVIGCDTLAYLQLANGETPYLGGCVSTCVSLENLINEGIEGSCSGVGCCQTAVPVGTNVGDIWFDERFNGSRVKNFSPCGYAMVVQDDVFAFNTSYITTNELKGQEMPLVIDWAIGNTSCDVARANKSSHACKSDNSVCINSVNGPGYLCNCSDGYQGNPYLVGGCQDIDHCASRPCHKRAECHNILGGDGYRCICPTGWRNRNENPTSECQLHSVVIIGSSAAAVAVLILVLGIYVFLEKRNLSQVKQKYFQQHGGWILLEQFKSIQGFGFTVFTSEQVVQATNNFNTSNIIGHGGQGIVYKGILKNQVVAIKKCKIVDESKKKEFGKEMLILSQINHKNIVKLIGCCLEVEVPMLIYEFIPNGTLFNYIHYKSQGSYISLQTRLRIAHESAEALAYLHTSASPPIFHGDVKSANILLDQNYISKVSDFGASMLAPTDEVQFVTIVQGTCGYLDPEYLQSCQLTDKSDVYSFGVVLVELLTGKPVIDFDAPEEDRSLSSRFLYAMKENKIQDLLDDDINCEDNIKLIMEVADLAKECLNMKGEERPTMKEVVEQLYRISKLQQHPWGQEYHLNETTVFLSEGSHHNIEIEHSGYYFHLDKEAEESIAFGR